MPGAVIAIDQDRPSGTSFGSPGVARKDLWKNRTIRPRCTTTGNTSFEWTLLSVPPDSGAEIEAGTEDQLACAFEPDKKGSYRLQLATNGGGPGNIQILILAVTKDSAGATLGRGWRIPAVGEQGTENNFDGQTNGWDPSVREIIEDIEENGFSGGGGGGTPAGGDDGVAARAANVSRRFDELTLVEDFDTAAADGSCEGVGIVTAFADTELPPLLYYVLDADIPSLRRVNTVTRAVSTVASLDDFGPLAVAGRMLIVVAEEKCFINRVPDSTIFEISPPVGVDFFEGYAVARYVPALDETFWFITCPEDDFVARVALDPNGDATADVAFTAGEPAAVTPNGIVVDNEGFIWVAYVDSEIVQKYSVDDTGALIPEGDPVGAHVSANLIFDGKYLFGINSADDQVVRIRVADGDVTLFDLSGLNNASSLAFDGQFVWVTFGSSIAAIDPESFEQVQRSSLGVSLGQVAVDDSRNLLIGVRATDDQSFFYATRGNHQVLDTLRLRNIADGDVLRADPTTGQVVGIAVEDLSGGGGGEPLMRYSPVDILPISPNIPSNLSGDNVMGASFFVRYGDPINTTGIRFLWAETGTWTVRCTLWSDTGAALETVDVVVTGPGAWTGTFSSPHSMAFQERYVVSAYEITGTKYTKCNSNAAVFTALTPARPFFGGSRMGWIAFNLWIAGDNFPTTTAVNELYLVEPVLALP